MTHILIPREPSAALLRPFIGCNTQELHEAWAAMVRAAEVQNARAGAAPAAPFGYAAYWPNQVEKATLFPPKLGDSTWAAFRNAGQIVTPLYERPAPAAPAVDASPLIARNLAEWHEDDGDVSWWAWCGHGWAGEPAWIGRPTDDGWPGYHTHWTAHPAMPPAIAAQAAAEGEHDAAD